MKTWNEYLSTWIHLFYGYIRADDGTKIYIYVCIVWILITKDFFLLPSQLYYSRACVYYLNFEELFGHEDEKWFHCRSILLCYVSVCVCMCRYYLLDSYVLVNLAWFKFAHTANSSTLFFFLCLLLLWAFGSILFVYEAKRKMKDKKKCACRNTRQITYDDENALIFARMYVTHVWWLTGWQRIFNWNLIQSRRRRQYQHCCFNENCRRVKKKRRLYTKSTLFAQALANKFQFFLFVIGTSIVCRSPIFDVFFFQLLLFLQTVWVWVLSKYDIDISPHHTCMYVSECSMCIVWYDVAWTTNDLSLAKQKVLQTFA